MALLSVQNLSFTYPSKVEPAIKDVSFSVESGEVITICGKTGCGKSTLLRNLKTVLTPHGTVTGNIYFNGRRLSELDLREQTQRIGYVMQNPENQIVTDKVWHELAFGLESLGYDTRSIRIRIAEMASFFGIQGWFMKNVSELSGGQKQLLNLAAIMAMQPELLILDEPTSQLDPIAASDFLETVKKINREIGTTIIMTEHRLEEVLPMSDRAVVLDRGSIVIDGTPQDVGQKLASLKHDMFLAMPSPMQIYASLHKAKNEMNSRFKEKIACGKPPITVRDGRRWLSIIFENSLVEIRDLNALNNNDSNNYNSSNDSNDSNVIDDSNKTKRRKKAIPNKITSFKIRDFIGKPRDSFKISDLISKPSDEYMAEFKDVWFKYNKNEPDVLKGLSMKIRTGQLHCIVGGNGTGKTTALSLLGGLYKPYRGKVMLRGKEISRYTREELYNGNLGILPQNPHTLFVGKTVELDLMEIIVNKEFSMDKKKSKVREIAKLMEIDGLLNMHPYDLSGGEQQRVALGKVLLLEPKLLLLDEPTKGLDNYFKAKLADIIKTLINKSTTVVMVSHDIEFCAKYADQCYMFFDGSIVSSNPPNLFFSGNSFYTTGANRMSRHIFDKAVTAEDVIELCMQNMAM
ncbi:MAG: ABC transporter ATP-binding protein [Anaerovoracaceae bacterium]|jgi:energy-coupling factor transporter ATP-binding protein EcfA2